MSSEEKFPICEIDEALAELRAGRMIILVDDEDRENEGDFVVAAEHADPDAINFMAKNGRGLVCLALDGEIVDRLQLPMQVKTGGKGGRGGGKFGTNWTAPIEAAHGVTTGISAADRSHTIKTAIHPDSTPADIVTPGHVFPLKAKPGGVLVRAGHTEGSTDLAGLAGLRRAAVICEIMNDDGTMARMPQLVEIAERLGLKITTIERLIQYRTMTEVLIEDVSQAKMPTDFGDFMAHAFVNKVDGSHHVALVRGQITPTEPTLVRVHSECLTGDAFHSQRCDCGDQLHAAMAQIAEEGKGVLLYMRQEGRGIGLVNKIRAYALQDKGRDTVEANVELGFPPDLRHYGIGAQILVKLGARKLRLMTNNPKKIVGLDGYGLEVVERVEIAVPPKDANLSYLQTKVKKMGHMLNISKPGAD